jgi:hypothetical protein
VGASDVIIVGCFRLREREIVKEEEGDEERNGKREYEEEEEEEEEEEKEERGRGDGVEGLSAIVANGIQVVHVLSQFVFLSEDERL